jgi:hypothetical protein
MQKQTKLTKECIMDTANVKAEILQSLSTDFAKRIENSSFLTYACEIAKNINEEELLKALLKELKESSHQLALSEWLLEAELTSESGSANYCACLRAYRAALLVAYAKRDFDLVYKLARMVGWNYPDDILEAVVNR